MCAGVRLKKQLKKYYSDKEPIDPSMMVSSYDPFYMKANRVYRPEYFEGSCSQATEQAVDPYDIVESEIDQRLYDEIPEQANDKKPEQAKVEHFYDSPQGESETTCEKKKRRPVKAQNRRHVAVEKPAETSADSFVTVKHEDKEHFYDMLDDVDESDKPWLYDLNSVERKLQEIDQREEEALAQPEVNHEHSKEIPPEVYNVISANTF